MNALVYAPGPFIGQRQLSDSIIGTQVLRGGGLAPPLALPQNTTATLYTITGGAIMVTALIGQVATTIGAGVNLSIGVAPSLGGANAVGLGGPTAIGSLVPGSLILMPFSVGVAGSNLVAPAIPLSGAPVTNNYHGTVTVVISGGTVTAVNINGVLAGSGDGTYQVPAHGTISITYSLAPTWVWTSSSALVTNANGVVNLSREHIVPAGTITWATNASVAGSIRWWLDYIQLDSQPGFNQSGIGLVNL
jgi:hypothetical protein